MANDLEVLEDHILFSNEQGVYIRQIQNKLSRSHTNGIINFTNLIKEENLQTFLGSFLTKGFSKFEKFGIFCAPILGITSIIQIIKYMLDATIKGYALHRLYGWSIGLVGALIASVTHFLICHRTVELNQHSRSSNGAERNSQPTTSQHHFSSLSPSSEQPGNLAVIRQQIQTRSYC